MVQTIAVQGCTAYSTELEGALGATEAAPLNTGYEQFSKNACLVF